MKRTWSTLTAFLAAGLASAALAGPPECVGPPEGGGPPEWAGPPGGDGPPGQTGKWKATLLHCGCAEDGTQLEFVEITVSNRSKGHLKHVAGSFDSCSSDGENYLDFVRTGSDCQVDDGQPLIGDDIAFCDDQVAGQACGEEVID